ncbi:MAG: ParA family protein [Myxococcota bacterium]|jgi:chromosome partitioning protein|nr:ParA family protein [Myxococcota bacterium]
MRSIAIACEKGGVGKTTVAVGLACGLAELGKRVLVVDTDHQAAATRWLGRDHLPGLTRTFAGHLPLERLIQPSCARGVSLVPASTSLVTLERTLGGDPGALFHLREAVDALGPDAFDYLVFDTPPSLGIVVNAVLCAAQEVVVPAEARPMGLAGLQRILATAGRVQRRHHPGLAAPRIVLSRTNHTAVSRTVEAEVRKRYGARVFETTIAERIAVARASGVNRPPSVHEPSGPVTRNFRLLASELDRIEVLPAIGREPKRRTPPTASPVVQQ